MSTSGATACFTLSRLKTYFRVISALWSSALCALSYPIRGSSNSSPLSSPYSDRPRNTSFISVLFFSSANNLSRSIPFFVSHLFSTLFMKKMARYRGTCWLTATTGKLRVCSTVGLLIEDDEKDDSEVEVYESSIKSPRNNEISLFFSSFSNSFLLSDNFSLTSLLFSSRIKVENSVLLASYWFDERNYLASHRENFVLNFYMKM